MTVAGIISAAQHSEVQAVIEIHAIETAFAIASESVGTANHAERLTLANRVFQGLIPKDRLALMVLTEPNIEAAVLAHLDDPASVLAPSDVLNRLSAVWTALAVAGF